MSYYVRENGVVVKKPGEDPEAKHLRSYYLPGDDNVYHCDSTPEEKAYWSKRYALEGEYERQEYLNNAIDEWKERLTKIDFIDAMPVRIYYRKWGLENNIHWCTSHPRLRGDDLKFIGSSWWQEFIPEDYGTYWAFSKKDFVPLLNGRTKYHYAKRFNY